MIVKMFEQNIYPATQNIPGMPGVLHKILKKENNKEMKKNSYWGLIPVILMIVSLNNLSCSKSPTEPAPEPTNTPVPVATATPASTSQPTATQVVTPLPTATVTCFNQNFEPGNGSVLYFSDTLETKSVLTSAQVHDGTRALETNFNNEAVMVGIYPSSLPPVDISGASTFKIWVYDTVGGNKISLFIGTVVPGTTFPVQSTMTTVHNQWTLISWPLTSFGNLDQTIFIMLSVESAGYYYFDGIHCP